MGLLCVYTMFLIALSSIALAVLLALGPLFIALLLFDATRRFFEAWLAQLANYALITILTVLVAALLLQIVAVLRGANRSAAAAAIMTVDSLNMLLVAVIVFLVMRQVMPIAAALAGGVSLSSFGMVSRFVAWGAGAGRYKERAAYARVNRASRTAAESDGTPTVTIPAPDVATRNSEAGPEAV